MSVPTSFLRNVTPRRSLIRQGPPLLSPILTRQGLLEGNLTERLIATKVQRVSRKVSILRAESQARDLCALLELTGFHQGLTRGLIGDFFGRDIQSHSGFMFVAHVCKELRDKIEEACGVVVRFDGEGKFRLLKDAEVMAILGLHLMRMAGDTDQLNQLAIKTPAAAVYSLIQRPLFGEEYGHAAD